MLRGGMAFGAHSHSHEILAPLSSEQQLDELTASKAMIKERLGVPVLSMCYPVGLPQSFSILTREAAEKAQYRVAFSFYGGFNPYGKIERYDVRRFAISARPPRFRLQTTLAAATGRYWF
jgi:peptidoglycan/xylan/chitin deacetylase (PgdA/CDA1 family)